MITKDRANREGACPKSSLRPAIHEEARHGRSANITEPINFLLHESELKLYGKGK